MPLDKDDLAMIDQLRRFNAMNWAICFSKSEVKRVLRLCEIALQHEGIVEDPQPIKSHK